jgi:hypothetical protein
VLVPLAAAARTRLIAFDAVDGTALCAGSGGILSVETIEKAALARRA